MLFQVVLAFEGLAADLAREGDVVLVGPLVYHQVVRLCKTALAILADEFAFGSHFSAKLPPFVTVYLHNREHLELARSDYDFTAYFEQQNLITTKNKKKHCLTTERLLCLLISVNFCFLSLFPFVCILFDTRTNQFFCLFLFN